jgi:hypothetical protein
MISPTAGIIDSQSVKASATEAGGALVGGRKIAASSGMMASFYSSMLHLANSSQSLPQWVTAMHDADQR